MKVRLTTAIGRCTASGVMVKNTPCAVQAGTSMLS